MTKKIAIIGSGFGGLGAATMLAKKGYEVEVFEKNEQLGGRASIFYAVKDKNGKWQEKFPKVENFNSNQDNLGHLHGKENEDDKNTQNVESANPTIYHLPSTKNISQEEKFLFDMGPSWYLMPDIFEAYFKKIGEDVNKRLNLKKLSPSYTIFFKGKKNPIKFYSDLEKDLPTIEAIESGAGEQLKKYLDLSEYQYEIAKKDFLYKSYDKLSDLFNKQAFKEGRKLHVLENMDKYVKRFFHTDELQKIMQYPLVFLGSSPYTTPALYNIMNHIDFNMGVFYPEGGIRKIVDSLIDIATENGVKFHLNSAVTKITVESGVVTGVVVNESALKFDAVISGADYAFTETLLDEGQANYSKEYWDKKVLAPSAMIMYLGVRGSVDNLTHHNLLFSADWKKNFAEIFDRPSLPSDPSLYVCVPSKTDSKVAPAGYENMFVLVPIAPRKEFGEKDLEEYAEKILDTISVEFSIPDLKERIVFKKFFTTKDFRSRYNSIGGTALGLAHTIKQTAIFRPKNFNKKVKGLYYAGANTNPGIGMPICLISAELAANKIDDYFSKNRTF